MDRISLGIGLLSLALTAHLGHRYVYVPQRTGLQQVQQRLEEERRITALQRETDEKIRLINQYRQFLPEEKDPAWLIREVAAVAERTGVTLVSITPQQPQEIEDVTRLAVSVIFQGDYHTVGRFIGELESAKHFLRVEQLEMEPEARSGEHPQVKLVISTIFLPAPEGLLRD